MENRIKGIVHKLKKFALDIVAPRKCAGCGKRDESFCAQCSRESFKYGAGCVFCNFRNNTGKICRQCQRHYPAPILQILWAGEYKHPVKNAVKELKYRRRTELASPMAKLIWKKFVEYLPKHEKENFVVVPVPMHPEKESKKGYNHSEILAQEFGKISGIEVAEKFLLKTRDTKTQVETKKKDERIKNLENAFEVKTPLLYKPACRTGREGVGGGINKTIILIDDVATTGATFMHASRALQKSGFDKIICLAIAHGYG